MSINVVSCTGNDYNGLRGTFLCENLNFEKSMENHELLTLFRNQNVSTLPTVFWPISNVLVKLPGAVWGSPMRQEDGCEALSFYKDTKVWYQGIKIPWCSKIMKCWADVDETLRVSLIRCKQLSTREPSTSWDSWTSEILDRSWPGDAYQRIFVHWKRFQWYRGHIPVWKPDF